MKKKVLLRGPCLTQSGYGIHTRQVARHLLSKPELDVYFQVLNWGNTPWFIDQEADFVKAIIEKSVNPSGMEFHSTFQVQLPNEWDHKLSPINIGITAGVETDVCNPTWIQDCNRMTKVIVPSSFTANLFKNSLTPVEVVPESYPDVLLKKEIKSDLDFSTDFNFLIFGQITGQNPENDRKNILYTLKWLFETFDGNKNVGVVIKTNLGRNSVFDRRATENLIKSISSEIRKSEFPKIHLIHGDLNDEETAVLYRHPKIKCLVSATRGEGYGLPLLEAAASGLPIIVTGWSGHLDFLNHGKFISLFYDLKTIHPTRVDNQIFVNGARWAEVQEMDFKKKVKKFYENSTIPKQWANDLKTKILEKYSFEAISKNYDQALKDII